MNNLNIYIIITTYNGIKWIPKCIDSCIKYKVVVIDNNSSDNTVNFVKENYPEVTLLNQSKNLGFGAANNIGISYALNNEADYVFLLNQDAYLEDNVIENLIQVHQKNKDYGVISPIHLNGIKNALDEKFQVYLNTNKYFLFDAIRNKYNKAIYDVSFVNAAAWLLPRKTLETIGGFDPIFYHYGEDENYCQRVLYHNLKIGIVPNTYILHDRENRKVNNSLNAVENLKNKERHYKRIWGNINEDVKADIKARKKLLGKTFFRLLIKLKFKKALSYFNELKMINQILPEIFNSRKNTIKARHNYL